MKKHICIVGLLLLILLPMGVPAEEAIFWTTDGYRRTAINEAGEGLLVSQDMGMVDGFARVTGVLFTILPADENGEIRVSRFAGGDGVEKLEYAIPADDGWICVGSTSSGDLNTGWHEGWYDGKETKSDGWVVRLDAQGEVIWSRAYGGSDWDVFYSVCPAIDGGWIVVGSTHSADGDVVGWHDSGELFTHPDGWMLHLDDNGEILWQRALGGSARDELMAVRQVPEGYLAVGMSGSDDGDVSGGFGGHDGWIVLVDERGELAYQACVGTEQDDTLQALGPQQDGAWLAAGTTWVPREAEEGYTAEGWAICLDARGQILWTRLFGADGKESPKTVVWVQDARQWAVAGISYRGTDSVEWIVCFPPDGGGWELMRGDL